MTLKCYNGLLIPFLVIRIRHLVKVNYLLTKRLLALFQYQTIKLI